MGMFDQATNLKLLSVTQKCASSFWRELMNVLCRSDHQDQTTIITLFINRVDFFIFVGRPSSRHNIMF